MAAETESGFTIDGKLYETPAIDTFSMDESQVLYDYSGLTIEDFVPEDGSKPDDNGEFELTDEQKQKMKNPGFLRALMHIAYQRGNPKMNPAKVKATVGSANLISALEHFGKDEEDDAGPPELTNKPGEVSPSSTGSSPESSGADSEKSSDGQVVPLTPTTTSESAMSSISDRTISVG